MKKLLLLTLLTLGFAGGMFAQEGVKVGFRATPLISWASLVDDSTKTKPDGLESGARLGFSFDFVFTYGFSENFGLWSGINIATRGFKSSFNLSIPAIGTDYSVESRTSFTAVEVPIGLKFRSPEIGSGLYIVGYFGVANELNVKNKTITTTEGNILGIPVNDEIETVDGDEFNLYTLSFTPGAGVNLETDFGMLEAVVTYHWGLLGFYDKDETGGLIGKLNSLGLSLGYYF